MFGEKWTKVLTKSKYTTTFMNKILMKISFKKQTHFYICTYFSREIQLKKVLYYTLPLPNSNFYSTVIYAREDKIAKQNS